jgi:hypothetical protein
VSAYVGSLKNLKDLKCLTERERERERERVKERERERVTLSSNPP